MKLILLCFLGLILLSCKKDNVPDHSYDLPWNAKFITYKNISIGNHGSGYQLFYKDSLIREEGESFGGPGISQAFLMNEQVLYLYKTHSVYPSLAVLYTKDGGNTWKSVNCGPRHSAKLHVVNPDHVYCVTQYQTRIFFTGIDQSDLKMYEDTMTSGIHYISDLGTNSDLDSTVININDTVQYVILFH
ncbi:MAG: hypothetical protein K0R65_701 [Crocinitomicaceae bacterium]|jgi:hypothetical protein|nr:hypothetical protein [Crocinitomicaceae bacterium]